MDIMPYFEKTSYAKHYSKSLWDYSSPTSQKIVRSTMLVIALYCKNKFKLQCMTLKLV